VPYLRAGVGASQVATPWSFSADSTIRLSYHAGAGLQGRLSEAFLLGLEARAVRIETLASYTENHRPGDPGLPVGQGGPGTPAATRTQGRARAGPAAASAPRRRASPSAPTALGGTACAAAQT
jgi:hypothetical protein